MLLCALCPKYRTQNAKPLKMKWRNNMKKKILALLIAVMLLLPLLAACGNGDNDTDSGRNNDAADTTQNNEAGNNAADATLSGTFVLEDDPVFSIIFSGNSFRMPFPYAEMGIPELDGNFYFSGTFEVNDRARTISLNFDEDAIIDSITDMVWVMLEMDPEMQEILNDPEMEEFLDMILDITIDSMIPMIMDEILDELAGLELTFEDGFERLYTDEGDAFIRQ